MNSFFFALGAAVPDRCALRRAITDHTLAPEADRVAHLSAGARLTAEQAALADTSARTLVEALRSGGASGIVQGLVREYDLSSREGVALMCLAEALLRIPDAATRDALIRDKIAYGDWRGHLDRKTPLFVNAATWGLVISSRFLAERDGSRLPRTLDALLHRCGEPVIRRGVDMAMRLMGEQFVTGQTIEDALKNSRPFVTRGFRYSYDMLGEAAMTAADAARYYRDYERAIHAIGRAAQGAGVYEGPGISIKLSALHPRYNRLQRDRVMAELLPHLAALARLARHYDIGFNIDAEEADRLELSLDLLEALCLDEALAGWQGIGFVVQSYQKRAPFVLDWVIDLARRTRHRIMVRLVKGAYWDSEIKRAQVDGLADFPVFTRKVHTDISYLACARKLLDAPDAVFPQFATHNAQTLASIYTLAGPDFSPGRFEFQCLHGMGESLYNEVVGSKKLDRPVRVYAPVGTHETLLAYLVRRLLENGANSSFVNRIQDPSVSVEDLICDPVTLLARLKPDQAIVPPLDLFRPERRNSVGLDLTNENTLRALGACLTKPATPFGEIHGVAVLNPADRSDVVGHIAFATLQAREDALARATRAALAWAAVPATDRARMLEMAADMVERDMAPLMGLIMREAGKTLANAVSEIREAVDFLRYYAAGIRAHAADATVRPLGVVTCISPWNFPLAIFLGQVSAALAAGNAVLAKPAEETPLIARAAVRILHDAGIPHDALHFVPGDGEAGAHLVGDPRVNAVLFTGSTAVARLIQKQLATRLNPDGRPVPLIAETGGQNALIVDSSALTEQVVADVMSSAFDSAGQRCSALRVLCLQDDCADRVLAMLKGAMREWRVGNPAHPQTDIGPVISAEARAGILDHVEAMRTRGYPVFQTDPTLECAQGTFVAPTLIEIDDLNTLGQEVFGPVLHVVRYARDALPALMKAINATGYALTFGVHSRVDHTIETLTAKAAAGNVYVNRNLVGAVVGVQPFGGHGLSGTGPKAGGPLYLRRLVAASSAIPAELERALPAPCGAFARWVGTNLPACPVVIPASTPLGAILTLPGPVGETNTYGLAPRGAVLCAGPTLADVCQQIVAALATGNDCLVPMPIYQSFPPLPDDLHGRIRSDRSASAIDAALCGGQGDVVRDVARRLADRDGPIVTLHTGDAQGAYSLEWLVAERVCTTNTTAAGGNVALMAMV
ncbi:bifunctional proline dehydrogenase/pyrroline-5-carboxylate dehydrogenase [Neoasaia chiangmaiensis NBRC 101099]|uniref:Bifunctional protein PutA n=2 Tax=Neoasaia chiangmaiensis TaxID=320497 RepID=A0A1U9KRR5_9PROT|nr:bifunctional proline dehydrogenase/L-glutamate gamma-semialdehyde dehydrogenase PutA [Neoasaia chiangmaiensis]AQS88442.1 trifunctional transcriptional regulator/proline dehydrogenase/L-glutamate gamma-semialdehyde dehydrogenase [Neoasaia chiangmaiensis]GBR36717.1 bifunctional proline dehydrogenase/pyrroline-5-carboxylate dehydrogenase [Neoasaia chiangmaiensis NBRC 101099]GEN15252.1 bifunctional protein PutA [Neoasaia chiangmaiensis]